MTDPARRPDLYVVVADLDAEKLLDALLRRGVEQGCLRPILWQIRRDPMRDSAVCHAPLRALAGVSPGCCRILVVFDHHGSGREDDTIASIEEDVLQDFQRAAFPAGDVRCVIFDPELETLLVPVWAWLADRLASRRKRAVPSAEAVVEKLRARGLDAAIDEWPALLAREPKCCFDSLLGLLNLKHESSLFQHVGETASVRALKTGQAVAKVAEALVEWFPP